MMKSLISLMWIALLADPLFADQFGNVLFQTPEGWTRVQQADSLLFIPRDVPEGFVFTLAIKKGEVLNGRTLRQYLDDRLSGELSAGGRVISTAPVQEFKTYSGLPVMSTTRVMATRENKHFLAQYFAIAAGERGEMVSIISNSQELIKKYSETVGRFVASLQFGSQQPQTTP